MDDINFSERARNEVCKEHLEKELLDVSNLKERQADECRLLEKGWSMALGDMKFAKETLLQANNSYSAFFPPSFFRTSSNSTLRDMRMTPGCLHVKKN